MRRILAIFTIVPLGLLPVACSDAATTDEVSYQIDQTVDALALDARAATLVIEVADGPVKVREVHRYAKGKPSTGHKVDGTTLRLSESGCNDDDVKCDTEFHVTMNAASTADVTAQAGAIKINGLTGNIRIKSEAASVEGTGLAGDSVTVETQAGAASLEFAKAPSLVKVTTNAGAVAVRLPGDAAYAVDTHTSVGGNKVSVQKDPASPHRVQVSTEVGAVEIEPLP